MKYCLIATGIWCLALTFVIFHDYTVYQLSRWLVCGVAIYCSMSAKGGWRWALAAVAVLFNPIVPFFLGRNVWKLADFGAACVFLTSAYLKNGIR